MAAEKITVSIKLEGDKELRNVQVASTDKVSTLEAHVGELLGQQCTLHAKSGARLPSALAVERCRVSHMDVLTAVVDRKSEVVVIGAGVAGLQAAVDLSRTKRFNVTVVDTKDYFEYTPGIMRAYMEPSLFNLIAFPVQPVFDRLGVAFVQGELKEFDANNQRCLVALGANDEVIQLPFDYCMLCNGCSFNPMSPTGESLWEPTTTEAARQASDWTQFDERSMQHRLHHIVEQNTVFKELNARNGSVLIHGAGYLGVQLATDLKHYFPQLSITIIDFLPRCLGPLPDEAVSYCQEYMDRVGIKSFYARKFERTERFWNSIDLPNGADLELVTLGVKAANRFVDGSMLSTRGPGGGGWLTFNKQLQVTDQAGVVWANGRVFVAGDANLGCIGGRGQFELPPIPKTVAASQAQAALACRNLVALENSAVAARMGEPRPARLAELQWPSQAGVFDISLGPEDGCCVHGAIWVKGSGSVKVFGLPAAQRKTKIERQLLRRYKAGQTSSDVTCCGARCTIS